MTRAPRQQPNKASLKHTPHCSSLPTVASLGVRVRLVPAEPDRQEEIAHLIMACETLRAEWERLFQRMIDLLNEGDDRAPASKNPPPVSDA
jgi:hypothetical protein